MGLEERTTEAPAVRESWLRARVELEGRTREASSVLESWLKTREDLTGQAARAVPASRTEPTSRMELAGQGAWAAQGQPPTQQWAPGWPPGHVGWRKPSSSSSSISESGALQHR